ncbi:antigen [Microsporum canis CBS 113480]|uniref:Antigen n=1 Tax=Arthroderma otae (strain ATCC MYA-4605 / CBS 113480) TaxID=554155 RepID=C5FPW1_ARTOC|nr:antigen [Microsporum canis CBS 113480]EEQ31716.1 antigen [Microsporum canis CBS 113480]
MAPLDHEALKTVVSTLAQKLDSLGIDYAIIPDPTRRTEDVDLVIHVNYLGQFGHAIPAYKLCRPGAAPLLVELEVFDFASWPQRPQYNIQAATRMTLNINGQAIKLFGPEWILREKILSQYQRQGGHKEEVDIGDISNMIPLAIAGRPELDFNQNQELHVALENLLQKRPDLTQTLKAKIKCSAVFETS